MTFRWWMLVAMVLGIGTVSAAAAPATGRPVAPAYDIRPFLAAHPVPEEILAEALSSGYRPPPYRPEAQPFRAMIDDFEGPVIDRFRWIIFDADGETNGEYYWGLSQCRARDGLQSLWAIGDGREGRQLPCGVQYPNGVMGVAILRLDLSGWPQTVTDLRLLFDVWLNTRSESVEGVVGDGLFVIYLRVLEDGSQQNVVLRGLTSQFPEDWWDSVEIQLTDVYDIYAAEPEHFNLAGQSNVLLEFLFKTKVEPGGELTEGVYIDNVRLEASSPPTPSPTPTLNPNYTPPTPTATLTPTVTATPTITPSPTEGTPPSPTPSPTDTATATPTRRVGGLIYLPMAMNQQAVPPATEPPTEPAVTELPTEPPTEPPAPASPTEPPATVTATEAAPPTQSPRPFSSDG